VRTLSIHVLAQVQRHNPEAWIMQVPQVARVFATARGCAAARLGAARPYHARRGARAQRPGRRVGSAGARETRVPHAAALTAPVSPTAAANERAPLREMREFKEAVCVDANSDPSDVVEE
jgi:hypothetical protein